MTLVELLAVIAVIVLLLTVLASSLQAAGRHNGSDICLSNLRSLGIAVRTYAEEYNEVLPGPLHPALYHDQTVETYTEMGYSPTNAEYYIGRQFTGLLRKVLGEEVTDRAVTCPVMDGIAPDRSFDEFTHETSRHVFPVHYGLNNYGYGLSDPPSGYTGNCRTTVPAYYFGYSPPSPPPTWGPDQTQLAFDNPPRPIGMIANASREWMIADAWYRGRAIPFQELQQDGPYQLEWTGESLPYFAPHFKRGGTAMFLDQGERSVAASVVRRQKSDGVTNTLFFDGHVGSVPSRTMIVSGFELLYGFPGTANPRLSSAQVEQIFSVATWE